MALGFIKQGTLGCVGLLNHGCEEGVLGDAVRIRTGGFGLPRVCAGSDGWREFRKDLIKASLLSPDPAEWQYWNEDFFFGEVRCRQWLKDRGGSGIAC
jgi:hypothetical protein